MSKLDQAIGAAWWYAVSKHKGQLYDKDPYTWHLEGVAEDVRAHFERLGMSDSDQLITAYNAALLHDVVEDTDATIENVEARFGKDVAFVVSYLTHDKSLDYDDYIDKLAVVPMARLIKLCDLRYHMSHLPQLARTNRERAIRLCDKYSGYYTWFTLLEINYTGDYSLEAING